MEPARISKNVVCQGANENLRQLFEDVPLDEAVPTAFHSSFTVGKLGV